MTRFLAFALISASLACASGCSTDETATTAGPSSSSSSSTTTGGGEGGGGSTTSSQGGGGQGGIGGSGAGGAGGDGGDGGDGGSIPCTDLTATELDASYVGPPDFETSDFLFFTAKTVAGEPYDQVSIDWYFDFGGSDDVADYAPWLVQDEDYSDCAVCLTMFEGCATVDGTIECDRTFIAAGGELTLTAIGRGGDRLTGTYDNVTFVEADIDFVTGTTDRIEGGEQRCIGSFAFDVAVVAETD